MPCPQKEAGSRVVIDSFICAAISLAQAQMQENPSLEQRLLQAVGREDIHRPLCFVAVPEQDLSVEAVEGHARWSLSGSADYVISVTSEDSKGERLRVASAPTDC